MTKDAIEGMLTARQYGRIRLKLNEIREKNQISKNQLSNYMGVSYNVLLRYCKDQEFGLVDLDFLARACYILQCDISDLLEYEPGKSSSISRE